ncbi:MAG: hypothetical protein H3C48_05765 [Chitinophagaceae bacterium]|nr:hypothetical protein [Chitinophagaceae bacterium]
MKKKLNDLIILILIAPLLLVSCDKDSVTKLVDPTIAKQEMLTGTWKQTDIVLGYSIPFAGQQLPVGFSLHNLVGYLPLTGPKITDTKDNVFVFNSDGTFNITGSTDFILPNTGNSGKWNLQAYGSALHLISSDQKDIPIWIDNMTSTDLKLGSLGFTVNVYEADPPKGANIPVFLIFEKQ